MGRRRLRSAWRWPCSCSALRRPPTRRSPPSRRSRRPAPPTAARSRSPERTSRRMEDPQLSTFGGDSNGTRPIQSLDARPRVPSQRRRLASDGEPSIVTNSAGVSTPAFTYTTTAAATCPGVPTFSPVERHRGLHGHDQRNDFIDARPPGCVSTPPASSSRRTQPRPAPRPSFRRGRRPVRSTSTRRPGKATSATNFTVTPVPAPTITSFTPTFGPTGTSVEITGTNFSGTVSGRASRRPG